MTDWERVEQLRAKDRDWASIATDPKVGFRAPKGAGDPGRALKGLYFQRRSRTQRVSATSTSAEKEGTRPSRTRTRRRRLRQVAFIATVVAVAAVVPFALGFEVSWIGALGLTDVLVAVALAGGLLLGGCLVAGGTRSLARWKRGVTTGAVVGLLLTVALVALSIHAGCPNLTTTAEGSPGGGWEFAANPVWTQNGEPVVFFLGSIACPYCSASSWAIQGAVWNFTTQHSGATYGVSKTGDAYPQTPEVRLDSISASGPYISWDGREGSDPNEITTPDLGCPESAYVNTYDPGGSIPFLVIGGQFLHSGTIIDPALLSPNGTPLTPPQVAADLATGSPPGSNTVCGTVLSAQYWIEAYFWKCDVNAHEPNPAPPQVESNSYVVADYEALG